ncbi:ELF1 (YKL160W) [Zygosaccharomyces parabailii]|uniref:Transcription elongation factor 1 homolog n=1 Tax=Zygosaccharomyces bailii (strain CLIB 213 / ATCC 58445 / CBS 680 / BCRC 21525 / NBRC 1098 / NCYC 1416 / NRRL Y-2227) TaxID=1333698 RepID=A0A8J2T6P6_ZYGB2|nr:ELF1 (YKL160W) [Zygosaccharomyces parabailii]CDF89162.1 ZYBA0S03-10616g1_1 [Zygosaccharomyces bailii CLIB 213]CDH16250.1 probable ELF1-Protein required for growth on glycerol mediumTranscription elongation factor, implicated in the maintenance of proper chromatin structure [Zygosaccharomyces bailii ISA1307]
MGKRKKSTRKPLKRLVMKLDTKFNCLFCNHDKSVTCTLDKKNSIGSLQCKICGQSFQTRINGLSQPVDVYSDWFDAVEEVNSGRGSESDDDEDSNSDYESDSDDGKPTGVAAAVDSDEEEVDDDDDEEDERVAHKRGRGALVDSDDE